MSLCRASDPQRIQGRGRDGGERGGGGGGGVDMKRKTETEGEKNA